MTVPEFVGAVKGYRKRMEHQWEHTRLVLSAIYNVNRAPNTPAIVPEEIIPLSFDKKRTIKISKLPTQDDMRRMAEKYKQ